MLRIWGATQVCRILRGISNALREFKVKLTDVHTELVKSETVPSAAALYPWFPPW